VFEVTSPALPYCLEHRCRQPDGYHNQDAPEGRYYPACLCEDRFWENPAPCLGCGRNVSHPSKAKWRLIPDWAYDEGLKRMPRVFCGLDCKHKVLTAEARARRRAARADSAVCSSCKREFTLKRVDSLYCSNACRQKAYRQRRPS
jgi:hypothetical protein